MQYIFGGGNPQQQAVPPAAPTQPAQPEVPEPDLNVEPDESGRLPVEEAGRRVAWIAQEVKKEGATPEQQQQIAYLAGQYQIATNEDQKAAILKQLEEAYSKIGGNQNAEQPAGQ